MGPRTRLAAVAALLCGLAGSSALAVAATGRGPEGRLPPRFVVLHNQENSATGTITNSLEVRSSATGALIRTIFRFPPPGPPDAADETLAPGGRTAYALRFGAYAQSVIQITAAGVRQVAPASAFALSPDGRELVTASASDPTTITVRDLRTHTSRTIRLQRLDENAQDGEVQLTWLGDGRIGALLLPGSGTLTRSFHGSGCEHPVSVVVACLAIVRVPATGALTATGDVIPGSAHVLTNEGGTLGGDPAIADGVVIASPVGARPTTHIALLRPSRGRVTVVPITSLNGIVSAITPGGAVLMSQLGDAIETARVTAGRLTGTHRLLVGDRVFTDLGW